MAAPNSCRVFGFIIQKRCHLLYNAPNSCFNIKYKSTLANHVRLLNRVELFGFYRGIKCYRAILGRSCGLKPLSNFSSEQRPGKRRLVLGIETSCDDTGVAVVDDNGKILGEALHSQTELHVRLGGILPPVARDQHKKHIENVVQTALQQADVQLNDLDAIAATVKPGLSLSLTVGLNHAKKLVAQSGKPFIPIHHMEAHALTARLIHSIEFPFLVLLVSGGHCLLLVARDVEDFLVLGRGLDDAPGDAFDKLARRLKIRNLPECEGLSGGASIEKLALRGDPLSYKLVRTLGQTPNCNFSFSGLKSSFLRLVAQEEARLGVEGGQVVPTSPDICASFQYSVLHHLAKRVQRGLLYCHMMGLLPENNSTLVVSGGVASNLFIREGLSKMCAAYDCHMVCPPPALCRDNGVMIAWNGIEKLRMGLGIAPDPEAVNIQPRCPFGEDISEDIGRRSIKLTRVKLL